MNEDKTIIKIKEFNPDLLQPTSKTQHIKEQGGIKTVVIGKPGTGKCLSPGTPIIMYDGTIKIVEDIKIGDKIMGDNSTVRNVLSICNGEEKMYRVVQLKGDDYSVNEPHILSLKCVDDVEDIKKNDIIDIPLKEYMKKDNKWKSKFKGYKVCVEFEEKQVPIDPYHIGYYLGGFDICDVQDSSYITQYSSVISTQYILENNHQYNTELNMAEYIFDQKLFGDTIKIPHEYKTNTGEIRLQLLAGLIDRIGTYDIQSRGFDIVVKSEKLIDDIIYISRSLGYSANKRKCIKRFGKKTFVAYKTFITGKISNIPCNIISIQNDCDKDVSNTSITVTYIGIGVYYGFQLDDNQRFLLGDFTVTHNTTLIESLLYSKKHIYPVGIAMSGTEDSNGSYKKIFPSTFVYNTYDEDIIRGFIKRQKISREYLENPWAVILIDDCTDDPGIFRSPLQQGMYKRGRHWKMWYILSLQYCMDVKPVIRTNVDGTFILRESNLKNRKSLWENYAGIIPDFKMFCDILDQITDNFTALYIHNATTSNKLEDCLFWYRATPAPKGFKFGCPDYWKFHEARYNKDYKDPFLSYN
jgi:hypothetical protein